MGTYLCINCGQLDVQGWTDYYIRCAMDLPSLCAVCEPRQRCHFHNEVTRRAQDEAGIGEVE